jgi:hypothetical protein
MTHTDGMAGVVSSDGSIMVFEISTIYQVVGTEQRKY